MNIGIIGLGDVADRWHAPAVKEAGMTLWSILGRSEEKTLEFAKRHGAKKAFTDLSTLLADKELDAVIIATPDSLHIPMALAAADAGKHMLIEKPLCTDSRDFGSLEQAVTREGVTAGVGYHLRHHHGHQRLRQEIRDGRLGNIQHLRLHWTYDFTANPGWRQNQNPWWSLAALGTHCIDLAGWLLGYDDVKNIVCSTSNTRFGSNDEEALLAFRLGHTSVEIYTSVLYKAPYQLDIYGTKGSAHATWTLGPRGGGTITINGNPLAFEQRNPYAEQLRALQRQIQGEKTALATLGQGIWNVRLMEAAYRNNFLNRPMAS
ncbi:Gfo/Idh/MocA family oxidoreductase [Candidatus Woesearchaeota archaeon]|nr:Gfo/Idh/MocA family oxidoreductase [Candidatus Woesearchaeota archaeon]